MKTRNILILISMLLLVFAMASCNLFFGTSIEERIEAFNSDVAADNWDILYTHFHPDTQERDDLMTGWSYWTNTPFGSNNNIATYTVSGDTVSGNMSLSGTVYIEMKLDGWDYKILTMTFSGTGEDLEIRTLK